MATRRERARYQLLRVQLDEATAQAVEKMAAFRKELIRSDADVVKLDELAQEVIWWAGEVRVLAYGLRVKAPVVTDAVLERRSTAA